MGLGDDYENITQLEVPCKKMALELIEKFKENIKCGIIVATITHDISCILSILVCVFYGFCGATFGLLSINTIAAVALDRFVVIARSQLVQSRPSSKLGAGLIIAAWVNSLVWALPPTLGWNRYILEGYQTTCSFDYLTHTTKDISLVLGMFVFAFVVPLLVIIVCYGYIFSVVYKHESTFRETSRCLNAPVRSGVRERAYRTELRIAKTVTLVLFFYLVSWTPYAVVALIGVSGHGDKLTPVASAIPGMMAKMSCIYNPVIYTLTHPSFKNKVRLLIPIVGKEPPNVSTLSVTKQHSVHADNAELPAQLRINGNRGKTNSQSSRQYSVSSVKGVWLLKTKPSTEETSLQMKQLQCNESTTLCDRVTLPSDSYQEPDVDSVSMTAQNHSCDNTFERRYIHTSWMELPTLSAGDIYPSKSQDNLNMRRSQSEHTGLHGYTGMLRKTHALPTVVQFSDWKPGEKADFV